MSPPKRPPSNKKPQATDSPFRPTGGVSSKLDAIDAETTVPGLSADLLDAALGKTTQDGLSPFDLPAESGIPTDPSTRPPSGRGFSRGRRGDVGPLSDVATQIGTAPTAEETGAAARPPTPTSPATPEPRPPVPTRPPPESRPPAAAGRSTQPLPRDGKKAKTAAVSEPVSPKLTAVIDKLEKLARDLKKLEAPVAHPGLVELGSKLEQVIGQTVDKLDTLSGPAPVSPELLELGNRLQTILGTTLTKIDGLSNAVDEAGKRRQELLNEARAVNKNYKQLVEKVIAERDGLSKELSHSRSQYANDAKSQAQAFTDLQRELEKERRENERKLGEAEDEVRRQNQRITELDNQLKESLESRDRIVARVREVELNLENTILPLREELDSAKAREAQTRVELESANKEIVALKLLAGGPPSRDR